MLKSAASGWRAAPTLASRFTIWRVALVVVSTILLIGPMPRSGKAADIEGVHFAEQYQRGDLILELHCVGLLRYKILFKGYVAGLYLGPVADPPDALADVSKRLEMSYFWRIDGADIREAGDRILAQNVAPDTLAGLRPRLEQINALYDSVEPGDRYALTYVPGLGTELALNGRSKGVIPGADFAAAYFRIWLGERPIDTALRDQLLTCTDRSVARADPGAARTDIR